MTRVLVTGASGLLGANLVHSWAERREVIGVTLTARLIHPRVEFRQADLAAPGVARRLFEEVRPEAVVHCAAATDVDRCEREPEWALRLNRDMAGLVAQAAAAIEAKLVHLSTDAVFGGTDRRHREEEPPSPVNVYGMSKLAGERAVLEAYPAAAIVRTSLFGWNAMTKMSLAEWFLERLSRRLFCPGFVDVVFSPILVTDLGDWIWRLLQHGVSGVWHIGGGSCLSKYDFGVRLARAFGLDPESIARSSVVDSGLTAKRPLGLCLDSSRVERTLGGRLPMIEDGVRRLRQMQDDGQRRALRAMALRAEETA